MIQAQCLCGSVAFESQEIPGMVFNCHCSRCRRAHGAAFATQVIADPASLKFLKGKERLKEFEEGGIVRAFCSHCGSRLMNYGTGRSEYLSVSLSAINGRDDLKPAGECFASSKLGFVRLDPGIAHFPGLP